MTRLPLATVLLAFPLAICAQSAAPAATPAAPSPLDGVWLGTLHAGGPNLRLQFRFHQDAAGKWTCALDSLDQGAMGIPCKVTSAVNPIAISVPAVHGGFTGSLAGDAISGSWSQGGAELTLKVERQTTAAAK